MSEPKPATQYHVTNGTHIDAVLTTPNVHAELVRARAALIQAGQALELAMGLPPEQRAILSRAERRGLNNE